MTARKKAFIATSLLYIIFIAAPILKDLSRLPVEMVSIVTTVILFVLYPKSFLNKTAFWTLTYFLILFLFLVFNKPLTIGIGTVHDSKKLIIEMAFILPSLAIFSVLHFLKDKKLYQYIFFPAIGALVLSFITILPALDVNSNILRDALHEDLLTVKTIGMPGYPLMHAYAILVPSFLFGALNTKGWTQVLLSSLFILLIYIVYRTYVTTSLLILLVVFFIILMSKIKNKNKIILTLGFISLFVFMLHASGTILDILDYLIVTFEETDVQSKIIDFKNIYITGSTSGAGTVEGRLGLHDTSLNSFIDNPIIGGDAVGGHSSLMDRLGGLGLLGFIPFLMIIVSQFKMNISLMKLPAMKLYYYLGFLVALMLLLIKGLFGQEGWLFLVVLMPGIIVAFSNLKIEKQL